MRCSGVFGKTARHNRHFGYLARGVRSHAVEATRLGVCGRQKNLIDFCILGTPVLFSTSHPRRWPHPSGASTCSREPQLIDALWNNTRFFKAGLRELGFNTGASQSPITPVIVGEASVAMKLSDRLFEAGVFAQGIGFPTVARDKARVRTIVTATHTRADLQFALDAFAKVGRELSLI